MTEPMTGGPIATPGDRPLPPVVRIAPPEDQSRLTIFFRVVMVVPHLVALYLFGIAAAFAALAGWVAALFMGRLPGPLFSFLSTYVRYATHVIAYLWLVAPRWPPFFAQAAYAVDLELEPTKLNRLAVLFRIVLVIPAALLQSFVTVGWALFSFFFWLIALVRGRLPDTVHAATGAVVRYTARVYAYMYLLTPAYPSGLWGDKPEGSPLAPPSAGPDAPAADTRVLRLAGGARNLVTAFVVVGVVGYAGGVAAAIALGGSNLQATVEVQAAWQELASETERFEQGIGGCRAEADPLACVKQQTGDLSADLDRFVGELRAIEFPDDATDEAAALMAAASEFRDAAQMLSQARSGGDYQEIAEASQIDQKGQRMDSAYTDLLRELRGY